MAASLLERWVLPRRLLTSHSPFFAREPADIHVLDIGDEEVFELFAQWLYVGELDSDGVNFSSETLIRTWTLGDIFECAAFRDHVMARLLKSHHERGIKPQTLDNIFVLADPGSKLRKWAIDQFHAMITYGYTDYDDHTKGDHPSDKDDWMKLATRLKEFSQDFLEACLDAGQGVNRVKKPWENGQQYMEVLRYAEIGVYKDEEGKSMKVEATLTKAEGS